MRIPRYTAALMLLTSLSTFGQAPTPSPTPDILQVLEKVNSFYASSFSQLMTLMLAMLGFAGVVLPIALQMIQARIFRHEKQTLEKRITTSVAAAQAELQTDLVKKFQADKTELQNTIRQELEALNAGFSQQVAVVKGTIFQLQATRHDDNDEHAYAAADYAYAARKLLEGRDERNSQRSIQYLLTSLAKLSRPDFITTPELEKHLNGLLAALAANNKDTRYSDKIDELGTEIAAAKKRTKPSRHED